MGLAKHQMSMDEENGFNSQPELNVCQKHFNNKAIINFFDKEHELDLECSFCSKDNKDSNYEKKPTVRWDSFMEEIMWRIKHFYDDPANGLGYNSSEGGYFPEPYSTSELLEDVLELDVEDSNVLDEIIDSINQDLWTEKFFYVESYTDYLNNTWEIFSNLVKYEVRYLFYEIKTNSERSLSINKPFSILQEIGNFFNKLDFFTELEDKSSFFYRARQHSITEQVKSREDISSPPKEFAGSNRFSPEGVSIFYGAEDTETAINEIIDKKNTSDCVSIGRFYANKKLNFIDLRNILNLDFFDIDDIKLIEPARFLKCFVKSITKKIDKNSNEKIEYVPSQIVTEYFRYFLPSVIGKEINGIVYKSTQNIGKDCYAIFADSKQCRNEDETNENALLTFDQSSLETIKISDIN